MKRDLPKRLAVFDFDCTLVNAETIDVLAAAHGVGEEVAAITKRAMEGELDFFDALERRVRLLAGMEIGRVRQAAAGMDPTRGAEETIARLKAAGYRVIVLSGGFSQVTGPFREVLGYDLDFSNVLHVEGGHLSGRVGGPMMFQDSKREMLKKLQALLQVDVANTLVCGDGANDLGMFECAGTKIAFGGKGVLDRFADIVIGEPDLTQVLTAVGLSTRR